MFIHIEPGPVQRGRFAQWAIAQTPPLQTVGHNAFDVPIALYATIPPELLDGAYVDGYPYVTKVPGAPELVEAPKPAATSRKPRKRAAKKAAPATPVIPPPVEHDGAFIPQWAAEQMDADVAAQAAKDARQDVERRHHIVEVAGAELPKSLVERTIDGDTPGWGSGA